LNIATTAVKIVLLVKPRPNDAPASGRRVGVSAVGLEMVALAIFQNHPGNRGVARDPKPDFCFWE
jgi:hypothetical protein